MFQLTNILGDGEARVLWQNGPQVQTGLSRDLDPSGHSFAMILGQQGDALLDSELNLIQKHLHQARRDTLRLIFTSGFRTRGAFDFSRVAQYPTGFLMGLSDGMYLGYPVTVGNAHQVEPVAEPNLIQFPAPPAAGTRTDLALLELWFAEVAPANAADTVSQNVYLHGGVDSGTLPNDLRDLNLPPRYPQAMTATSALPRETTRRVQLRWRLRTVAGVDLVAHPFGIDAPTVTAQGDAPTPSAYTFTQSRDDGGLWVAGDGSQAAGAALGSVDGYAFAVPIAGVIRQAGETAIAPANVTDLRLPISASIAGDTIIQGSLTVLGKYERLEATDTYIRDSVFTLNDGETGNGITGNPDYPRQAGFEVKRGTLPTAHLLFQEALGVAGGWMLDYPLWVNGGLTLTATNPVISTSAPNSNLELEASGTGTLFLQRGATGPVNLFAGQILFDSLGDGTFKGNVGVLGTLSVTGTTTSTGLFIAQAGLTANGPVQVSGTNPLTVGAGLTSLGGDLAVAGKTTLAGQLTASGGLAITADGAAIAGDSSVTGKLSVTGILSQAGNQVLDTLNPGAGMAITGAGNARTIANTGVLSLVSDSAALNISAATGGVKLGLKLGNGLGIDAGGNLYTLLNLQALPGAYPGNGVAGAIGDSGILLASGDTTRSELLFRQGGNPGAAGTGGIRWSYFGANEFFLQRPYGVGAGGASFQPLTLGFFDGATYHDTLKLFPSGDVAFLVNASWPGGYKSTIADQFKYLWVVGAEDPNNQLRLGGVWNQPGIYAQAADGTPRSLKLGASSGSVEVGVPGGGQNFHVFGDIAGDGTGTFGAMTSTGDIRSNSGSVYCNGFLSSGDSHTNGTGYFGGMQVYGDLHVNGRGYFGSMAETNFFMSSGGNISLRSWSNGSPAIVQDNPGTNLYLTTNSAHIGVVAALGIGNVENAGTPGSVTATQDLVLGSWSGNFYFKVTSGSSYGFTQAAGVIHGTFNGTTADVAEYVPVSDQTIGAADVVVVDPTTEDHLAKSAIPYDTSVLGIVSTEPAVVLGDELPADQTQFTKNATGFTTADHLWERALALCGRVPCKVTLRRPDGTVGPDIGIGNLLVTSGLPGRAMRALPADNGGSIPEGTVLAKALQAFKHVPPSATKATNATAATLATLTGEIAPFGSVTNGSYPLTVAADPAIAGNVIFTWNGLAAPSMAWVAGATLTIDGGSAGKLTVTLGNAAPALPATDTVTVAGEVVSGTIKVLVHLG